MKRSVALPFMLGFLLASCGKHEPTSSAPAASDATPVEVSALTVSPKKHTATEDIVGTVRSRQRSLVEAKISGRVLQYLTSPGQLVKSGVTLATLDVEEIKAKVDQARAVLEQTKRDFDRQKQLVDSGATTRQEFDAADARLKMATAGLTEAETMLGYARVTAPFDGVVTRKLADVGDLAMPGKPLAEVEAPTDLRFEADFPEAVLARVKTGDSMSIRLSSSSASNQGTVSEISPVADPVSRTFLVKLDIANGEGIRSGQFGRVAVPVAETDIIAIPTTSVIKRGQMEVVFVVREGRASLRLVKTGRALQDHIEILSGLEQGELVVASNIASLADGQPVKVKP